MTMRPPFKHPSSAAGAPNKNSFGGSCPVLDEHVFHAGDLSGYDGSEGHPGQALLRDSENYSDIESDLTFVGLAGLQVSHSSSQSLFEVALPMVSRARLHDSL